MPRGEKPQMQEQFKVGETVRLKSGGPVMTIGTLEVGQDCKVFAFCGWFEGKKLSQKTFPVEMLERAN
jgi:uncharacterized protein YodC (DUF2158 family)